MRLRAYLEVMRPANIVTAFADILAGFAVAGGIVTFQGVLPFFSPLEVGWLLLSTFGLYGGGVVFNDFFDAELDAEERPERPIPSGRATKTGVGILGTLLFLVGMLAAFQVNAYSVVLAILITAGALLYDSWAKHSSLWGPLFMGLCRGWNLLLGCSLVPIVILVDWYLPFLAIAYIGGRGSLWGGAVIAFPFIFFIESLRSNLTELPGLHLVIYGLLLIVVMIFYPGGFAQLYNDVADRLWRNRGKNNVAAASG